MCVPSGKRIEVKNVSYEMCADCGKPIRGTGKTMGGTAVFVVKNFVRAGKIVDFVGDWRRLCESVGFELVEEIHASLIKREEYPGLFGEPVVKETKRASFFRRLAEKKGSPPIDHEDVLIFRKPE